MNSFQNGNSKKLIQATVPMCPDCGGEARFSMDGGTRGYRCARGHWSGIHRIDWGYYAPDVAAKIRRFAGDRDWEYGNGEPADLRGWADELEGKND